MPYIGNTIRAADDYRLIDDISSGFNGSDTSFALQVAGSAPVPFPKSPQQVLISVNGVIQEPDPTGASGFNLVGTNIVFSSAPTNGHAFFGIIYATADYLNSGGNFPSGSLGAPSITFVGDEDTGIYRKGSGSVAFVADSTEIANTDSNGLTISSGNLIIPDSIIHNGDTNTKIRFPAADTVAIETAGSERLRVDSAGRLMLGTTSPEAVLTLNNTGQTTQTLLHCEDTGGSGAHSHIALKNTTGDVASILTNSDNLEFRVDDATVFLDISANEHMRIDSSGKIGIGTTTIGNKVQVHEASSNASFAGFSNDTTGSTSSDGLIVGIDSDENGVLYHYENKAIRFATNNSERMRLDSSGRLLIGTTNNTPAASNQAGIVFGDNTAGVATAGIASFCADGAAPLLLTRRVSDGNVLGIADDAGTIGLLRVNSSDFEMRSTNNMRFQTGGSNERMRINSSGKLSTGGESSPDVSAGGLCLNQASESTNILTFKSSDIAHGVTTFDETDTYFSARKSSDNKGGLRLHAFTDQAGADPAFEFHGIIASDAAVGYVPFEFRGHEANGTGTQNIAADRRIAKFTNSDGTIISSITGTGITFGSDTAAANALDDYEEGTFTPQFMVSGSESSGVNYSSRAGTYTKIGRKVTVNIMFELNNNGSTNGQVEFGALPFTVADTLSNTSHEATGSVGYMVNMSDSVYYLSVSALHSSTRLMLMGQISHDTGFDHIQRSSTSNTFSVRASCTYFTS